MHDSIAKFPNLFFYQNKLLTEFKGTNTEKINIFENDWREIFINVDGHEEY